MSTAKEDVFIERKDLGPAAYTFIAKGEEIPADLADLPHYGRDNWPPKETPKRA